MKLIINDNKVEAKEGVTILEASILNRVYIPTICYHPDLRAGRGLKPKDVIYRGNDFFECVEFKETEGCQLCVVEVKDRGIVTSCDTQISEGMVIYTETPEIKKIRKDRLSQILAKHPHVCLTCAQREGCTREPCSMNVPVEERCCIKFGNCELQKVTEYIGIKEDTPRWIPTNKPILKDEPLFNRDYNLCIECTRCVRACESLANADALGFIIHNGDVIVGSVKSTFRESKCKFCGACVEVCPTGALLDKDPNRPSKSKIRINIAKVPLPPEKWLEFNEENIKAVPEVEGVFTLYDENKMTIYIKGTQNLRKELEEELKTMEKAKYFEYEEDPMYTKRESELIQQFMQKYGKLPEGNDILDDLF
jgi:predicted molibdopterin-dependent oxidoreductase YjgC